MSFTIEITVFTILAGVVGSFLANHYSVYALLLVTGCSGGSRLRGLRRKPFRERDRRLVWRGGTAIRLFASALLTTLTTNRAPVGCYVLRFEAPTIRHLQRYARRSVPHSGNSSIHKVSASVHGGRLS